VSERVGLKLAGSQRRPSDAGLSYCSQELCVLGSLHACSPAPVTCFEQVTLPASIIALQSLP
jgi:hypothetical protein